MATSYRIRTLELLAQPMTAPNEVDLLGELSGSVLFEGNVVAPLDEGCHAN